MGETVCAMMGEGNVTDKEFLMVNKELPTTEAEKAKTFNEKAKAVTEGIKGVEIKVVSKIAAGDMYDEITDVMPCLHTGHKHKTEEKTSIKHNEGEVILIDFWATWCPPCQAPMAHNQKMIEENPDWEGKIRIRPSLNHTLRLRNGLALSTSSEEVQMLLKFMASEVSLMLCLSTKLVRSSSKDTLQTDQISRVTWKSSLMERCQKVSEELRVVPME